MAFSMSLKMDKLMSTTLKTSLQGFKLMSKTIRTSFTSLQRVKVNERVSQDISQVDKANEHGIQVSGDVARDLCSSITVLLSFSGRIYNLICL